MIPSPGDLIWCAQAPGECPPYVGWGVRWAVAALAVSLVVAIALRTVRGRAILCALWFGLLPWWVYEPRCHYTCGYVAHLRLNLRYAWMWATWQETAEDVEFERAVNVRPNWVRGMGRPARITGEQITGAHTSEYSLTEEADPW